MSIMRIVNGVCVCINMRMRAFLLGGKQGSLESHYQARRASRVWVVSGQREAREDSEGRGERFGRVYPILHPPEARPCSFPRRDR